MPGEKFRAGAAMTDITPRKMLKNYNGAALDYDPEASPLRCHAVALFFEGSAGKSAAL